MIERFRQLRTLKNAIQNERGSTGRASHADVVGEASVRPLPTAGHDQIEIARPTYASVRSVRLIVHP